MCGEDVPRKARACPKCGADERSGWKEDAAIYDGLDLPDDDREAFDAAESGDQNGRSTLQRFWWAIAVLLLLVLLFFILSNIP